MVATDFRLDSEGRRPEWQPGQQAWFAKLGQEVTVIEQVLHYEYPRTYWGNVRLQYHDGRQGVANSWQLSTITK